VGKTVPTNYKCERHFLLYTIAEQWRICKKAKGYSIKEIRIEIYDELNAQFLLIQ
jgi:hypothetical protein